MPTILDKADVSQPIFTSGQRRDIQRGGPRESSEELGGSKKWTATVCSKASFPLLLLLLLLPFRLSGETHSDGEQKENATLSRFNGAFPSLFHQPESRLRER